MDFLVSNTKAKIIYYGHDLHFLREMREYELTGDEKTKENSEHWKVKELKLMRQADVVYYPSQIEADIINEIEADINVKAIPAYIFDDSKKSIEYEMNNRSGVMFIGGFGHKPNVDAVIWYVQEVLPHVLEKNDTIKTYILGSNPPKEIQELASNNVIIKGFVTDEELEQFYRRCRMSIVPLRYGAGIKGKVIEGMYNQIPILTTSVGAEGILNSEDSLVVVDDAKEYAEALANLYEDEEKLKDLSAHSLQYVKENYSMKKVEEIVGADFDF
ncbi:glycosyltransferase family 4 protein [Cellulosilyticum ruminicola]|uniref:glycosyltransferase family 4 protein n=1 Tax=Cellulosilyticum ruminicola TaxID=425254 RepID=UPI0006D1B12E|nr:glycosyltransferase family 4 protein [Cellulosilyticum ruminicola]